MKRKYHLRNSQRSFNIRMYLSRTIKGLRYHPIRKLPSWPAIVSQVLAGETILLAQKKWKLIAVARVSIFLLRFSQAPVPTGRCKEGQVTPERVGDCLRGEKP